MIAKKLDEIRTWASPDSCPGLRRDQLEPFFDDPDLELALERAIAARPAYLELISGRSETELIDFLQAGFKNFYARAGLAPYVPIAAQGPWLISSHGAVIFESGAYGMLGFGHSPQEILPILAQPVLMTNIQTATFHQRRFMQRLQSRIGFTRKEGCPYSHFQCINSGSECVSLALRLSDLQAKKMTDAGGRFAAASIKFVSLQGAFHGRTQRSAQASASSQRYYQNLATFRDQKPLLTSPPNDSKALEALFARAKAENIFIESMLLEPVMGEGNPGLAITREFYETCRRLTREHGSYLIVDSIQAGLRVQGVLSIVDYPGFEGVDAPDMECFSKMINAGQYPLSVLGLTRPVADSYTPSLYGNTMSTNSRALEVACKVLELQTQELTQNIRERGKEFVEKLKQLQADATLKIVKVQGTGLLVSAELDPSLSTGGPTGAATEMRRRGVQVLQGGVNALRFTPHFWVNSKQIELMVQVLGETLRALAGIK